MFQLSKPQKFDILAFKHADVILKNSFPVEWNEINEMLENFKINKSWLIEGGGRKSKIADAVDKHLIEKNGWFEKEFQTSIVSDGISRENPTHKIDCYKNRIAFELEWNNKTEFYDRDLNNFRILHQLDNISLGIIMTRATSLNDTLKDYKIMSKYGASTTHGDKLLKKIDGGGSGGCPIIVIQIKSECIDESS